MRLVLQTSLLLFFFSQFVSASLASPLLTGADFVVNDVADLVDDHIGDGVCHTAANTCTLRAAVMEANQTPASDRIHLPVGTLLLSLEGWSEDVAATGDLDILAPLTILGSGSDITIVDANHLDRAFETIGGISATFQDLTVKNGRAVGPIMDEGGALLASGPLTLTRVLIESSYADYGGGLKGSASLQLTDVTIKGNSVFGRCGGIDNSGRATLTRVTIEDNLAQDFGGGMCNRGGASTTLDHSVIYSNRSEANGGGIFVSESSALTLTESIVRGNSSLFSGGGIQNQGALTITRTILENNYAGTAGGALCHCGNGSYIPPGFFMNITDSSFLNNQAEYNDGGVATSGPATLLRVTLASNQAYYSGGGMSAGGDTTLVNDTFSGNTSMDGAGLGTDANVLIQSSTFGRNILLPNGYGASLSAHRDGTRIQNTILDSAFSYNCAGMLPVSNGHNLDSGSNCFDRLAAGDRINLSARLGALGNFGGFTQVLPIWPGSPAVDGGANSGCPATDQRGVPRPIDGDGNGVATCDIGAFEMNGSQLLLPVLTR